MAITESDIINAIMDYTYLSVQTKAESEATPPTNTSANILYNSRSRRQGNFQSFKALANLQISKDETLYGIALSDEYKLMAYAYFIQYLYERKFKDYNAKQVSSGGDSITREGSSALKSYYEVFASAKEIDSSIVRHTDYTNYPADWKNTQLPITDIKNI